MALYIIGDLHLSFSSNKPMDVFGPCWVNHHERIKENWERVVTEQDTVIVAGDISWAISLEEALVDLTWLDQLPGKKILLRGNHDYWWTTLKKMRLHVNTIEFLQNNAFIIEGIGIVGTRGWNVPLNAEGTSQDHKVFNRECARLDLSIAALKQLEKGLDPSESSLKGIIGVLHYPPFDEKGNNSKLNTILAQNQINQVFYGHIHSHYHMVFQGERQNISYQLISADYVEFTPVPVVIQRPILASEHALNDMEE